MRPVAAQALIQSLLVRIGPYAESPAESRALERAARMLGRPAPHVHRDVVAARGLRGLVAWAAERTDAEGRAG